ncbi:molybdate transport system permease protein [Andreprevotia lacus DSM 23236]|jgi:molybdate transport system permease protein|uniref:Molybdenum transport system permease n=2 Tax=Andreprevotia TaxID=397275 RepID=A0A1W1WZ48_9NEIS|nr:molybdate transport system permease protein [Andreprevotia lacus DSM 23236]
MLMDWQPLLLTLRLAALVTLVLLLIGIPLAGWLALTRSRAKPVVEALLAMPLVLPPSVLGFYLLLAFSPHNALGAWLLQVFGLKLVFSFAGLMVASVLFSLPFMVQPLQAGFETLPTSLIDAAHTLGKGYWTILLRVLLPNARGALLAGSVLAFAHTVGEFGVVLMIGGNIPGVTRVVSIAIYDEVESLNYAAAHGQAAVLVALSFAVVICLYLAKSRRRLKA